ncbi:YbaB/EbfC family nucleoid-associated protein [Micromonospora sp. WMMD967]|uniref:YbaB/EbfC family nucleoid-associated protein n=1 Tax=Micromonospora sp. WMMD967 TaxID=3016101 RepID=UPI002416B426|nr:YbaB/EbfC family nucleoid-associated protein [Micromonospora sp. WMMD967]MDG4838272.1 YbaB/EbfC family nucleoid-associated protein [Micromonospora sp. WMMD967]
MQHGSRRERPELASLDFLGDDSVLREQADRALRETGRELRAADCSAADHSGSVRVVVDAQREVSAVTIARDWRSRLGPSGFADALFEAYAAAVQAALEAAALLHLQTQERDPAASDQEPLDRSPDRDVDEYTWLRDTWRTLSDLDADLDAAARRTTRTDESGMSSPNGCLRLRIRGGGIIGITGDVRRIARADAGQLQFEARSLFRAFELARAGRTGS